MPVDARVLIVARDDDLAEPLARGLDNLGWRAITARGPYAALAATADLALEAVVVDIRSCGQDAVTLARRLKAVCDLSPIRFTQRIRGEAATELLATTSLSVDEIAQRVGYTEPSTLRRLLRRDTNRSPSALRSAG